MSEVSCEFLQVRVDDVDDDEEEEGAINPLPSPRKHHHCVSIFPIIFPHLQ